MGRKPAIEKSSEDDYDGDEHDRLKRTGGRLSDDLAKSIVKEVAGLSAGSMRS